MQISSQVYVYFLFFLLLFDKLKSQSQDNGNNVKPNMNEEDMSSHDKDRIGEEFAEYDLNRDGLVDPEEIELVLKNMNKHDFVNFFTKVDIDSSGTISLYEYMVFIESN